MQGCLSALGRWFFRFMVIFSFIVNVILVVVVIGLVVALFDIKNNIADPLISGLHTTAVGLNEATIDWTIPVRDSIPVVLDIQLDADTTVTIKEPVPLNVSAVIDLPGINAYGVSANVSLSLPAGLELPISLNLPVPVDEMLDIALDVRAVIPISETQLTDPINTLGLLFEPLAIGLHNLPNDFNQAGQLAGRILNGESIPQMLLATDGSGFNPEPYIAWPGYSKTAGMNYTLGNIPFPAENMPSSTGIVARGGIPSLDELIRPEIWQLGGPTAVNAEALERLQNQGIDPSYYGGSISAPEGSGQPNVDNTSPDTMQTSTPPDEITPMATATEPREDLGIMPTPSQP
ncbi:hypothetical protein MASR2M15_02080 [Anaerolineales bacterium]